MQPHTLLAREALHEPHLKNQLQFALLFRNFGHPNGPRNS